MRKLLTMVTGVAFMLMMAFGMFVGMPSTASAATICQTAAGPDGQTQFVGESAEACAEAVAAAYGCNVVETTNGAYVAQNCTSSGSGACQVVVSEGGSNIVQGNCGTDADTDTDTTTDTDTDTTTDTDTDTTTDTDTDTTTDTDTDTTTDTDTDTTTDTDTDTTTDTDTDTTTDTDTDTTTDTDTDTTTDTDTDTTMDTDTDTTTDTDTDTTMDTDTDTTMDTETSSEAAVVGELPSTGSGPDGGSSSTIVLAGMSAASAVLGMAAFFVSRDRQASSR